ncbi:MAG: urease accessory protein UreF [Nitrospiraceae bacterium]
METLALVNGLRFIDSLFPTGGFAYSSGLEAAVQAGLVRTSGDLARYVEDSLQFGLGPREAVAAARAHQAVVLGQLAPALDADRELDAMKLVKEARLASRQMGRQVMRIAGAQSGAAPLLLQYREAVEEGRTPGHFPVCLGLTLGTIGWTRSATVAAFLYHSIAGYLSAALKLLPIGQQEGQRLIERWLPLVSRVSEHTDPASSLISWTPIQDLYAMRHRRLASRLFRS